MPIAAIGWQEVLVVVFAVLLLFGARKLPELGRGLAEGMREFRKASRNAAEDEGGSPAADSQQERTQESKS